MWRYAYENLATTTSFYDSVLPRDSTAYPLEYTCIKKTYWKGAGVR